MGFGIPPSPFPPSFSYAKIHVRSLCTRPCAGRGNAEMNQNLTLLLEGSQSGGEDRSGQRAQGS